MISCAASHDDFVINQPFVVTTVASLPVAHFECGHRIANQEGMLAGPAIDVYVEKPSRVFITTLLCSPDGSYR